MKLEVSYHHHTDVYDTQKQISSLTGKGVKKTKGLIMKHRDLAQISNKRSMYIHVLYYPWYINILTVGN